MIFGQGFDSPLLHKKDRKVFFYWSGESNVITSDIYPYELGFGSPVKIFFRYKVRQTEDGDPLKRILIGIIYSDNTVLPPESFQRPNGAAALFHVP